MTQEAATEAQIRAAYDQLARRSFIVSLADLRPLVAASHADVTDTLKAMTRTGLVHLMPISNRKGLTDADRAAAIRIGSEDKHLLVIETD